MPLSRTILVCGLLCIAGCIPPTSRENLDLLLSNDSDHRVRVSLLMDGTETTFELTSFEERTESLETLPKSVQVTAITALSDELELPIPISDIDVLRLGKNYQAGDRLLVQINDSELVLRFERPTAP